MERWSGSETVEWMASRQREREEKLRVEGLLTETMVKGRRMFFGLLLLGSDFG